MRSTRIFPSTFALALAGLLFVGGCRKLNQQPANNQAAATAAQPSVPPPPPDQPGAAPPPAVSPSTGTAAALPPAAQGPPPVIPAGAHIAVTIQQALGSRISQAGETFIARVARPIILNGQVVIPAGAPASGTVVDAKPLGRFKGKAYLALRLDTVRTMGATYQIRSSTLERVEQGKGARTAGFVSGGAGFGAILGGIAGGGRGAVVGGLLGGGAGAAGAGLTGKQEILIPAETTLTFRLSRAVNMSQ